MTDQTVIVPLDGSELAERALPYATAYAKAFGAKLLLITAWEGAEDALVSTLPGVADNLFRVAEQHYEAYLVGVAKKIKDVPVDAEVVPGHAVDEIARIAEERKAGMLVLATHGLSGLGRWWFGSVANGLIRRVAVPRLAIGPTVLEQETTALIPKRILVPLDASEEAEAALGPALRYAKLVGAEIVLAQVLGWAAHAFIFDVPADAVTNIDQELTKASEAYLSKVSKRLGTERPVRREVLHGVAADSLIEFVARESIDLVVMTSHGRGGLARVALGSVTDRMLHASAPVLIIRPPAG